MLDNTLGWALTPKDAQMVQSKGGDHSILPREAQHSGEAHGRSCVSAKRTIAWDGTDWCVQSCDIERLTQN